MASPANLDDPAMLAMLALEVRAGGESRRRENICIYCDDNYST
jgi:hypothetical protein